MSWWLVGNCLYKSHLAQAQYTLLTSPGLDNLLPRESKKTTEDNWLWQLRTVFHTKCGEILSGIHVACNMLSWILKSEDSLSIAQFKQTVTNDSVSYHTFFMQDTYCSCSYQWKTQQRWLYNKVFSFSIIHFHLLNFFTTL